MKQDERKPSEKEVYRLWWEYLKRSEKYKAYCSLVPQAVKIAKKKKGGSWQIIIVSLIKSKFSFGDDVLFDVFIEEYAPKIWKRFGDIFNNSFDDWWKKINLDYYKLPVIVLNDPNNACKALPFFAEEFRNRKKRKNIYPSPEEALKILAKSEYEFIFLAVPMVGKVTIEDISKQIADIRKKWKNEFATRDFYFRRFRMPVSRVRLDEMKRYLRVYDLKQQGKTMKEIIAEIDPDRRGEEANVLRSFRNDLRKAKDIVSSVEGGSFPEEPVL